MTSDRTWHLAGVKRLVLTLIWNVAVKVWHLTKILLRWTHVHGLSLALLSVVVDLLWRNILSSFLLFLTVKLVHLGAFWSDYVALPLIRLACVRHFVS